MTIPVGGDIGEEVHTVDQILTFTSGQAKATVSGKDQDVKAGDLVSALEHNFHKKSWNVGWMRIYMELPSSNLPIYIYIYKAAPASFSNFSSVLDQS